MSSKNYIENCMMTAPGLAIVTGSSPLVKYANTIYCKAGGLVGTPVTTAHLPSLALSTGAGPLVAGSAPAVTDIPTLKARYFTAVAIINPTTTAVTFRWQHGPDFSEITDIGRTQYINGAIKSNEAIVGVICIINGSASDFVPGTTALDLALVTTLYQDDYGYTGA